VVVGSPSGGYITDVGREITPPDERIADGTLTVPYLPAERAAAVGEIELPADGCSR
jgi:hypothetical protein